MKTWPVQDAKARFSQLLSDCEKEGPQIVTRRGVETAVVVPIEQWRRIATEGPMSLKELLLTDWARADLEIPDRKKWRWRKPEPLE